MTISQRLRTYSNTDNSSGFDFPTIFELYNISKIDWDTLYKTIAIISVESSNSFYEIERMDFHKFYSLSKYVIDYLEDKAKRENGDSGENSAMEQSNNMMSQAKSQMSGLKTGFNPSNFKLK